MDYVANGIDDFVLSAQVFDVGRFAYGYYLHYKKKYCEQTAYHGHLSEKHQVCEAMYFGKENDDVDAEGYQEAAYVGYKLSHGAFQSPGGALFVAQTGFVETGDKVDCHSADDDKTRYGSNHCRLPNVGDELVHHSNKIKVRIFKV